jgi:hypothetical protein
MTIVIFFDRGKNAGTAPAGAAGERGINMKDAVAGAAPGRAGEGERNQNIRRHGRKLEA